MFNSTADVLVSRAVWGFMSVVRAHGPVHALLIAKSMDGRASVEGGQS